MRRWAGLSIEQKTHSRVINAAIVALLAMAPVSAANVGEVTRGGPLKFERCRPQGIQEDVSCTVYFVLENRDRSGGRKLPLQIVVVPARSRAAAEPIFYLVGGPGQPATDFAARIVSSPLRDTNDVVLIDQRGTGEGNRLDCPALGSAENLQGYLEQPFQPSLASRCARNLQRSADLTRYRTVDFIADLDEIRAALGYGKIFIVGGSFGAYAGLEYIREHGDHVRAAAFIGPVLKENRVPLNHAAAAQEAFINLVQECKSDEACSRAYPNFAKDFKTAVARLRKAPIQTVATGEDGRQQRVTLTASGFIDAVRIMLYGGGRKLPLLLDRAAGGDYQPFAETAVTSNRLFARDIRMGLHLAVTCNEFVSRIRTSEIKPAARGSVFETGRVRAQIATCRQWPKAQLPADFFKGFHSNVPVLLLSGTVDPVIRPRWGKFATSFLTNSRYVTVPGGHNPRNTCVDGLLKQLLRERSVLTIDVSCVRHVDPQPFELPALRSRELER